MVELLSNGGIEQVMRIFFTNHALERFEQRGLPHYSSDRDFVWHKDWARNEKSRAKNVETLKKMFSKAEENGSFLNNTRFLVYLYERYGGYNYKFYVLEEIVFLLLDEEKVVTILPNGNLPLVENKKYVKKKKVSEQEKLYEKYKEHIELISNYEKHIPVVQTFKDKKFSNEEELKVLLSELYGSSEYELLGKISGTRNLYSISDTYFIVQKNKIETIEEYRSKNPDFCLNSVLNLFDEIQIEC